MSQSVPGTDARLRIGEREIGGTRPTYVIAEAGVNHRGDLGLARELVRQAHAAGADAIKFQTYKADTLVTRWAPRYWEDAEESGTQYEIFRRSDSFGADEYRALADECGEQGIDFLSTPFDLPAVALLARLGVPAFKLASADLTNRALLREVASTGKPVLQSVGASTLAEVADWLEAARECQIRDLALLHCVLCYPTALADANLRRIGLLAERFPGVVIGLSDHTDAAVSVEMSVAAVALGARLIEKHFTLDRSWPGDDHYHSADPDGLARMIAAVRTTERALGVAYEDVLPCEKEPRRYARRSIVAARRIACGEVICEEALIMKRPGTGIPPTELDAVLGSRAACDIEEDSAISWDQLAR